MQLRHAEARDFTDLPHGAFDTVIVNSVAQYLPDADYLLEVLTGAARLVGADGQIFIGDLRHLAHVPMFHASVQLSRASMQTTLRQLKSRIARTVAQDKELVLDPAFFHAVGAHLGMRAQIQLRRGRFANELTHYRYDVVLSGQNAGSAEALEVLDGNDGEVLARL